MAGTVSKKSALFIATLSSFINPFFGSATQIALPSIAEDFHMDAISLSWVATSYILATVVSLVPFGRLADIHGRKKLFLYGYILFTLSSLLCGLSPSGPILIFFRVLQGIGSAMHFATGIAILLSVYPPQQRGKVLGITVAAVYTGLSLGPFLGGLLTQYLTWRSVFLLTVPLGVLVILIVLWKLKGEWAEARGETFDVFGTLIYGCALVAGMLGITMLPDLKSLWLIMTGLLGIAAFIKWELHVKSPVFELDLFRRNRVFAFSSMAALINYSATFALTFLLSLYLQHIKGLSPQGAGLILVSQPVVQAVLSPFAGRLSDRIEPRIVASIGMALTTLGLSLLTFLNTGTSLGYIVGCLMILGMGFALFSSPNTNAIMGSVEKRFYGLASGSVGTMRQLGMMISMGIATLIFAVFIGRVQITPDTYAAFITSVKTAFTVFAVLCFGGIFSSMVRGKLR